jgi:hypothetical protein
VPSSELSLAPRPASCTPGEDSATALRIEAAVTAESAATAIEHEAALQRGASDKAKTDYASELATLEQRYETTRKTERAAGLAKESELSKRCESLVINLSDKEAELLAANTMLVAIKHQLAEATSLATLSDRILAEAHAAAEARSLEEAGNYTEILAKMRSSYEQRINNMQADIEAKKLAAEMMDKAARSSLPIEREKQLAEVGKKKKTTATYLTGVKCGGLTLCNIVLFILGNILVLFGTCGVFVSGLGTSTSRTVKTGGNGMLGIYARNIILIGLLTQGATHYAPEPSEIPLDVLAMATTARTPTQCCLFDNGASSCITSSYHGEIAGSRRPTEVPSGFLQGKGKLMCDTTFLARRDIAGTGGGSVACTIMKWQRTDETQLEIISEGYLRDEMGCSFVDKPGQARRCTFPNGTTISLYMSANRLGFARFLQLDLDCTPMQCKEAAVDITAESPSSTLASDGYCSASLCEIPVASSSDKSSYNGRLTGPNTLKWQLTPDESAKLKIPSSEEGKLKRLSKVQRYSVDLTGPMSAESLFSEEIQYLLACSGTTVESSTPHMPEEPSSIECGWQNS